MISINGSDGGYFNKSTSGIISSYIKLTFLTEPAKFGNGPDLRFFYIIKIYILKIF